NEQNEPVRLGAQPGPAETSQALRMTRRACGAEGPPIVVGGRSASRWMAPSNGKGRPAERVALTSFRLVTRPRRSDVDAGDLHGRVVLAVALLLVVTLAALVLVDRDLRPGARPEH